ncbi:MAG: hypothetical protein DLM54_01885 [Acidimicrobiales bacterium]|nr:MAG: hypothetical protein DLM54_01885 [Acidimicrobiales bacterium]
MRRRPPPWAGRIGPATAEAWSPQAIPNRDVGGFSREPSQETAAKGRHAWEVARSMLASGEWDLLILDELTYAVKYGWVPVAEVVAGISDRAPKTNVVVTGRDAPDELIEVADTVTEMRKVKRAYDQGIVAKKGIEY